MGHPQNEDLRGRIVEAASEIIATQGLAALSMRDLAAAIGKSTTVIFNALQTKAGVVGAVIEVAMAQDRAFHQAFFREIDGLELDRERVVSIAARYVLDRAGEGRRFARIWQECLLDVSAASATGDAMRRWADMRAQAWRDVFARDPRLTPLSSVFSSYLVMEEFYASALHDRLAYELLLREVLGGVIGVALGEPPPLRDAPMAGWVVEGLTPPEPPSRRLEAGSLKLRLLEIAADQIMEVGIGAVTNRSVTLRAGTSTSTILYHFGDMRSFLVEAIWHSVFRDIPEYLDSRRPLDLERPTDLAGLSRLLSPTLDLPPSEPAGRVGFYVMYARLIAQICLMARRDPAFRDLAMMLRGPEGWGTYGRREVVWPPMFDMTRLSAAAFALWIKGYALLRSAAAAPAADTRDAQLRDAALALVPQFPGSPNE